MYSVLLFPKAAAPPTRTTKSGTIKSRPRDFEFSARAATTSAKRSHTRETDVASHMVEQSRIRQLATSCLSEEPDGQTRASGRHDTGPQTPTMADDGPQIVRPVPRRPFNLNLNITSSTIPDEVDDDDDQVSPPSDFALSQRDLSSPRFLNPSITPTDAASISRPPSFLNLTSSTLMGIYSQATANSRDRAYMDRDEPDTPWGTGAQTPIKRPSIDDATYELMRDRSHLPRRRSSYRPGGETGSSLLTSAPGTALSLTLRAGLLFLLGVGYGLLVTRLHTEQQYLADLAEGIIKPGANWTYLAFWGVSGVVLGSLLPWFDKFWERTFGSELDDDAVAGGDGGGAGEKELGPGTDWALVMRAIGAFVGIVFAIVSIPPRLFPSPVKPV